MVGMARRRGAAMPAKGARGSGEGVMSEGGESEERRASCPPPRRDPFGLGHIRESPPSAQIRASFPRKSELPRISTIIPTALTPPFQRTHACPRSRTQLGSPPNHPPHPTHAPPGPRGPPRGVGQKSRHSHASPNVHEFQHPFERHSRDCSSAPTRAHGRSFRVTLAPRRPRDVVHSIERAPFFIHAFIQPHTPTHATPLHALRPHPPRHPRRHAL